MFLKRIYTVFILLLLSGLVAGCQTLGQYSLSEQFVNSALQKQLSHYNQSVDAGDLFKMNVTFNNMNLNIGRQEANKVVADGTAKAAIQTPLGKQNVSLRLNLKALPELNKQQNAIFLRQVEIADYQLDSSLGSISSGLFLPYLNQALQLYFEHNPVYQLDKTNQLEYLAFQTASTIKIEQGKFVFSLK